ncbi:MAG: DUF2029 domain-containing protein [Chloroflexi bacterium]|nr:MAG: DUF2029 domain-containing protein [Chloroflexota bacterium]
MLRAGRLSGWPRAPWPPDGPPSTRSGAGSPTSSSIRFTRTSASSTWRPKPGGATDGRPSTTRAPCARSPAHSPPTTGPSTACSRTCTPHSWRGCSPPLPFSQSRWPTSCGLPSYYGQPTFLVIALVAVAWWLIRREQMLAAGIALALATALKPQVVFMIPICLLVAGRFKAVVGWAGACAVLAALSAVALGPAGLASYWEALRLGQADVGHTFFTVAYLFGLHLGPATYAVLAVQGIACLYVAWSRREDLDIVFAAGLLGTLMVSIHLHQPDYSNLVLAAWLVLRGTPSLAHRLWFGVGIVTMQVLTLGQPVPQLLWDAGWLTILGVGGIKPRRESLSHDRSAEPAAEPVV